MKRLLALVLSLLLLVPAALAAPAYEDALPGYYKPPLMNEGQYPIKGENLKLTYWMPIDAGAAQFIASYEENPSYQLIQQNTGVDIEFIHPTAGMQQESFQLLLGGELPATGFPTRVNVPLAVKPQGLDYAELGMRIQIPTLDVDVELAGVPKENVIQCRVYTPDVAYWDDINVEYVKYFGDHRPARVVVPTGPLHFGSLVEIEALAAVPEEK